MIRHICAITCIACFLLLLNVYGEEDITPEGLIIQGKQFIETGINNWNEQDLLQGRALFERILSQDEENYLYNYYLGYADYRLTYFYEEKERISQYLEDGIEHLTRSIELKDDFSESHALLGSLYGSKISIKPLLGMTLGPKSGQEIARAIELNPENPRAYLLDGISKLHTPAIWGGGVDRAIKSLLKAISLFDSIPAPDSLMPDWGHDEAYVWLGNCHMEKEDYKSAKEQFEKALEINPDNGWVKNELLKVVEEKLKESQM
ncbi:tetratricopeptide repeat protein [candidate division WOR-3 bacterium]|nr:tetratricopeptide repeat protein [candidate division WOR-3 bacterium]